MSEIFNPIKGLPIVKSLSLPTDTEYFVGKDKSIFYVKATTDQGEILLYNGITLGLKVVPDHFDTAGTQSVTIRYNNGHGLAEVIEETTVEVQQDVPTKISLCKEPVQRIFGEEEIPNIRGAEFLITYKSGKVEKKDWNSISATLSGSTLTYSFKEYGTTVTTTSEVIIATLSSIQASLAKDSYKAGEEVKIGKVIGKYTDGSTKVITDYEYAPKIVEVGDTKVTITYDSFSQEIPIEVINIFVKISITSEDFSAGEVFNPEKVSVELTKADNSKEKISLLDKRISYNAVETINFTTPFTVTYKDEYTTLTGTALLKVKDSSFEESAKVVLDETKETELNTETAKVVIPAGAVSGSQAQMTIAAIDTTTDKLAVEEGVNEIETIDLNLTVDSKNVSQFNEPISVTVSTVKGLNEGDVKVYHGTEALDVTNYDSDTGALTFKTSHFSVFRIGTTAAVINTTTKTGYSSLKTAIENIEDGNLVKLYKDINEGTLIVDNGKAFTLNIGSCEITSPSIVIKLLHGNVNITGAGVLRETEEYGFGVVYILGSPTEDVPNYSVIKIGENITLKGWAGVFVDYLDETKYCGYGIVVDSAANIQCPLKGETNSNGYGVYINGTSTKTEGNIPKITLSGKITVNNEATTVNDGNGIYAAGYADFTLTNTTIKAPESAIEIRAGKMNVSGGSYTSTAKEYAVNANGNGTAVKGAAFAVAQHTTKLPTEVTLENVTLNGVTGLAVENPQGNSAADCAKVSVTGSNVKYKATTNTQIADDFELSGNDKNFKIVVKAEEADSNE